jgi:hypothetical protein
MPKQRRIFWKSDVKHAIAVRAFEIKTDSNWADTDLEAIRVAMRELVDPADWRELTQMQQADFVQPIWRELVAKGHRAAPKRAAIQPVVSPKIEHDVVQQFQTNLSLDKFTTAEIMGEFMKRIVHMMDPETQRRLMREEINAVLDRRLPGMLPPDPALSQPTPVSEVTASQPAKRLPKILVLGLQGAQRNSLEKTYQGHVHFFFLDGDEGLKRVKNTMDTMDFTFKTKWCKGNLDGLRGQNLTYVNGTDSIHRLITDKFGIRIEK